MVIALDSDATTSEFANTLRTGLHHKGMIMSPSHIGIVGVTYESAALCYRTICNEGKGIFGHFEHPEITMLTFSLNTYKQPSGPSAGPGSARSS